MWTRSSGWMSVGDLKLGGRRFAPADSLEHLECSW